MSSSDELFEQNENLRHVIRQMRQQMEQLGHEMPAKLDPHTNTDQGACSRL